MAKIAFANMSRDELVEEMAETFCIGELRGALEIAETQLLELVAPEPIHVWCDGGCQFDGKPDARGYYSFHVYESSSFGSGCRRALLPASLPQTNDTAEYYAMLMALTYLWNNLGKVPQRTVVIHTDSALAHGQMCLGWKRTTAHLSQLWKECMNSLDALAVYHAIEIKKEPREAIEQVLGH